MVIMEMKKKSAISSVVQ